MQSLRTKIETIDEDMRNIPDFIRTQARCTDSQFSRVFTRLEDIERKVDALPRIIAEMIAEQKRGG